MIAQNGQLGGGVAGALGGTVEFFEKSMSTWSCSSELLWHSSILKPPPPATL